MNLQFKIFMKSFPILMIIIMTFVGGLSASPSQNEEDLTGAEIIDKVDELLTTYTSYSKMQMTIETTSGNKRTFVFESWSKNDGEKNLVRYLEPRRVKDQATLMLNDANDIWMYFPRTERVRKLATHAKKRKMQGSDFSYEDMGGSGDFSKDYTAKRLDDEEKNGHECYKIELTRKPDSDKSYSRLLIWVKKDNFHPVVIEYYDEEDPDYLQKVLTQSNIEMIDGIPTAKKMVMKNLNDQSQTIMEVLEIAYGIEISDRKFTERGLKE